MSKTKKGAKKEMTAAGGRLHDECVRLHGSVSRTARLADVHYDTLRSRFYGSDASIDSETIRKLENVGITRDLVLATVLPPSKT